MAADDTKPDRNSYKPGDEGTRLFDADLASWYKRHPDQAPKAGSQAVTGSAAQAVADPNRTGGIRVDQGQAAAPIGDVSGRISLHSAGEGAPDPSLPQYQGIAGAARFDKDTKAWKAMGSKREAIKKIP
jgi:hypothetical protein